MTFSPLNWRCEARRETFSMRAAPYPDLFLSCSVQCDAYLCDGRGSTWWRWWCYQSNSNFLNPHCLNTLTLMLLGSMYLRSWLIQLNRSYKFSENIARTRISTLNGHISETVHFEKLKKIRCNYFFDLGSRYRWFQNFMQCVFCHFLLIWVRFWSFFGC